MQRHSHLPEEQLLSLLATGDKLAFKQLYLSNFGAVFGYALKLTRSSQLAEDIAQDVFLKLWECKEAAAAIRNVRCYLLTICKNRTLNLLARASREAHVTDQLIYGAQLCHHDAEHDFEHQECERLLHEAIDQLPSQRRLIFRLCKIEGKSYEEVAGRLGVTTGTVNDHIVKGIRSVKEFLKRYNVKLLR